ncbi:Glycosyl transferase, group 2 family protein [Microbacterium esteraromaticum]|uniref:Glycosyl transferase, group 2 family protein n=1 Tax=Microbacterium esteraromaticum TaxID=57043 RepID=A0A1R4JEL9_9MICO|nr:glycosyltransferase family A protein [Microbacterium esteraromaticum]SJN30477.1 Glycosyl transferase, group 2 family protein [Microbacterium esteraromaticum]
MTGPSTLKVSVVVATYKSGGGLDRLVASLDAQSLPAADWEVIFVDDGSPDETWDRLLRIQADRTNVRLERIENSGWPCRPRNVGTDLALGEYVAYMDHDDELYPNALRDAYAFAKAHGADALNGKEARTTDIGWALDSYPMDMPQTLDRTEQFCLSPTNPHKLYRREFLNQHGIRFREGGRVLWEDVFFNVLVAKYAEVISTMAGTPYYHWCTTKGSGSTSFLRSQTEWWRWLEEMVVAIEGDLTSDHLLAQRTVLMEHQYRSRLIDTFNNRYALRAPDEKKMIFERARRIQALHFPERYDQALSTSGRMRAILLRRGYRHLLERLTVDDPNIPGRPRITEVKWEQGAFRLKTMADWTDANGNSYRLRRQGDRLFRDIDPRYGDVVGSHLLDMTDEIRASSLSLLVRSVRTKVAWAVPSESVPWLAKTGVDWGVRGHATVDPVSAAMGQPLERSVWELGARCALPGSSQYRLARSQTLRPAVHVDADGAMAVYARQDGVVILDFDQTESTLVRLLQPVGAPTRDGTTLRIELSGLTADVDTRISTRVDIDPRSTVHRAAALLGSLLRRPRNAHTTDRSGWRTIDAVLHVESGRGFLEFEAAPRASMRIRLGERVPGSRGVYGLRSFGRTSHTGRRHG